MSDLATLLTAIGGLVTSLCGGAALLISAVRSSRRERPQAARSVADQLIEAAADGELTPDEIQGILRGGDS
mgnify:CR=1 FL=1